MYDCSDCFYSRLCRVCIDPWIHECPRSKKKRKASNFTSTFARTELYRSFYEPNGVRRQTVLIFPTSHGTSMVISIDCAATHPCGHREAAMLSTIAPLLETSYRLVSRAEGNLVWPPADADGSTMRAAAAPRTGRRSP